MNKRWTLILGLMAGIFVACTPAPAKGILQVNIAGLPSGTDANVVATPASGTALTFTSSGPQDADAGDYTIVANEVTAGTQAFTATLDKTTVTVTSDPTTPAVVNVTYKAKAVLGSATPAKTFTSTLGIGSLSFLSSGGPGQGRLYGSGNAATGADPSGRLFVDPATATSAAPVAIPAAQIKAGDGLLELVFNKTSGLLFELRRDVSATFQTLITRYPRDTAFQNVFTPLDFVVTNGYFTSAIAPAGPDRNLIAPTDMALDAAGNLWVVDPTSTARREIPSSPAGRLVCYSAADQTAAAAAAVDSRKIDSPGAIYANAVITGATTLAFDTAGNLWLAAPNRLVRIKPGAGGLACPNLNPVTGPSFPAIDAAAIDRNLTVSQLGSPADMLVEGNNVWVVNAGTANNLLKFDATATTVPATIPTTTITGREGTLTSIAQAADGRLWIGTAGATAPNLGRIYQLPSSVR